MNDEAKDIIEGLLDTLASDLINSGSHVNAEIAMTNATGFGLDSGEVTSAEFINRRSQIEFEAELQISGDQDTEKPSSGTNIEAVVTGLAERKRDEWVITKYEEVSAEATDL